MSIHDKWSSEEASDWVVTPSTVKLQPVKKAEKKIEKAQGSSKAVLFIGLQISGADALAIEGGEKPEDFHVTLAYGHFDQTFDDDDVDARVQHAIDEIRDLIPDSIHFDAQGRFEASKSSDGKDVIYAQVAAGQLEKAHDGLLEALKKHGIELEGTFPTYKPHMTLAYIEAGAEFELKKLDAAGTATKVMIGHGWESTKEHNYTIAKTDDDKRLVFGWASISFTADGEQLEDLQHDIINPEDLEEAVYEYVLNFRDTGEEHRPHLRKKGKLVESCVFTLEKQKAMGLPEGILPVGWWIGFKIEDDEAWEKVKNGTYRMFSIEGKAQRVPVEKAVETVEKFNHYHDELGRFASAPGGGGASVKESPDRGKPSEDGSMKTAIVYHGSNAKFDKFDSSKIGDKHQVNQYGEGFYFADTPEQARLYGDTVYTVELKYSTDRRAAKKTGRTQDYQYRENSGIWTVPYDFAGNLTIMGSMDASAGVKKTEPVSDRFDYIEEFDFP